MGDSTQQYHLGELKVALDPSHPSNILPPALPESHTVLDIGCGAGQTLIAAYPDRVSFGIDVDAAALKLGRSLTRHVQFTCAKAEALPYSDARFDLVVARVSLPYTNLRKSFQEIRRVLKKGGALWITLHPFSMVWSHAQSSRSYKGWIYFSYILLNGALFHLTRHQIPYLGFRYESFQTESGVTRALRQFGFEDISIQRGRYFLVTARAK